MLRHFKYYNEWKTTMRHFLKTSLLIKNFFLVFFLNAI